MKNRYKSINFSSAPSILVEAPESVDFSWSDSIYDSHRNFTHAFVPERLPDGTEMKRLVNDVELCMSTDPSVRSVVSPEYQQRLREGLLNQPRSGKQTGSLSDDEIAAHVIPDGLEHDEVADFIRQGLDLVASSTQSSPDDVPPSDATTC